MVLGMSANADLERIGINVHAHRQGVASSLTFMAEHYREPITADAIAAAGGYALRSLQQAMQRDVGRTSIEVLAALRLEAGRDMLQNSPEQFTVKQVAARVGMPHPGRFSVRYRVRFGETPTETLRARSQ